MDKPETVYRVDVKRVDSGVEYFDVTSWALGAKFLELAIAKTGRVLLVHVDQIEWWEVPLLKKEQSEYED